jgi:hypothetical protein
MEGLGMKLSLLHRSARSDRCNSLPINTAEQHATTVHYDGLSTAAANSPRAVVTATCSPAAAACSAHVPHEVAARLYAAVLLLEWVTERSTLDGLVDAHLLGCRRDIRRRAADNARYLLTQLQARAARVYP